MEAERRGGKNHNNPEGEMLCNVQGDDASVNRQSDERFGE